MVSRFLESKPRPESCWRSVILFGRNVATYKFALSRALIEVAKKGEELVTLEELAVPYSRFLTEHLRLCGKQATSRSSKFIESCRNFNSGEIDQSELLDTTVSLGFKNVIDAFHVVGNSDIPIRFFVDERRARGAIRLTSAFFEMKDQCIHSDLDVETESRWRLVETAWSLDISPKLLEVKTDALNDELYVNTSGSRRISITGSRPALAGYQKGRCFYCSKYISSFSQGKELADVDHFFPKCLESSGDFPNINLDGVWNLVVACKDCNRGVGGKFEKIPVILYLEKLFDRNEYLISSHHPLRETLINQTGALSSQRINFLQSVDQRSIDLIPARWHPKDDFRHSSCGNL